MQIMPPLVLLDVLAHPAQSESVNAVTVSFGLCHLNLITNLGLPRRYLPILFTNFQLLTLGVAICLAASLTEY